MSTCASWIGRHIVPFVILTGALHGQPVPRAVPGAAPTPRVAAAVPADTAPPVRAWKSPVAAAGLGLVLPGAGHWYAGERGRGTLVAAVYWTGVALTAGGRTDRVGHVGGVALLGALGVGVVDGARAAGRWNRRRVTAALPTAPDTLK